MDIEPSQTTNHSAYSPKWQFRFNFFDQYGSQLSPEGKVASRKLKFLDRTKIGMNFFALFFGWICFLCLGMWRKALSLIGLTLVIGILAGMLLPEGVARAVLVAFSLFVGTSTNYQYYLHKIKNSTSWNPFEGMRLW